MKVKGCAAREEHLHTHTQKLFTEQKVSVNIPLIGLMKTQAEHNHKLYHNKPLNMDYGGTTLSFPLSLAPSLVFNIGLFSQ